MCHKIALIFWHKLFYCPLFYFYLQTYTHVCTKFVTSYSLFNYKTSFDLFPASMLQDQGGKHLKKMCHCYLFGNILLFSTIYLESSSLLHKKERIYVFACFTSKRGGNIIYFNYWQLRIALIDTFTHTYINTFIVKKKEIKIKVMLNCLHIVI